MVLLRSCCICWSLKVKSLYSNGNLVHIYSMFKTGTFVLGSLGIILGAILVAPMSVFLEYHSFYVTQFVASGRDSGKFVDDDQVRSVSVLY